MKVARRNRRGMAAIVMVAVLIVVQLIIVGMVLTGARDHDLTVRRLETIEAFYAAEAGMNMAIREMMEPADEDNDDALNPVADDGIGTISYDAPAPNDANDPAFGNAQVVVTAQADTPTAGDTTLTSQGRSGVARREMQAVLQ